MVEFERENINGAGIWVPRNSCHVLFAMPNIESGYFDKDGGINMMFKAVGVRGEGEGKEIHYQHFSPSVWELRRNFPGIYCSRE